MLKDRKNRKDRINNRRKIIIFLLVSALILSFVIVTDIFTQRYRNNRSAVFRTEGGKFQIYRDKKWEDFTVKGVHIDFGEEANSAVFPGFGSGYTKKEYRRWFKLIADMNANVILVQRVLPPEFYQAFYEFNALAKKPLFLLQGIWVNDNNKPLSDVYDNNLILNISEEIRNTIDTIHGKASFKKKIAPYVIGFILGIETDNDFITDANQQNTKVMGFEGDYLFTENASPYEAWLAALGNYTIFYEQEKYGGPQRLVGWLNRSLKSPDEMSAVDLEHIFVTEKCGAGIFASYAFFPFRPDAGRPEYGDLIAKLGSSHTMPVIAAEFGVLSSRDRNRAIGISSGVFSEKEQGDLLAGLFDSIMNAGFSGGIVYTWYDGAGIEPGYGLMVWEQLKASYTILKDKFTEY